MIVTPYDDLIAATARLFQIPADILHAQVLIESSGHTDAFRFEVGIWDQIQAGHLHPSPLIASPVLHNARRVASSYGLLQILYLTAMDEGLGAHTSPEALFVPEVGLPAGARHMARLLARTGGDVVKALTAYNGGLGALDHLVPAAHVYAMRVMEQAGRSWPPSAAA